MYDGLDQSVQFSGRTRRRRMEESAECPASWYVGEVPLPGLPIETTSNGMRVLDMAELDIDPGRVASRSERLNGSGLRGGEDERCCCCCCCCCRRRLRRSRRRWVLRSVVDVVVFGVEGFGEFSERDSSKERFDWSRWAARPVDSARSDFRFVICLKF
jgi:hypothetical protein